MKEWPNTSQISGTVTSLSVAQSAGAVEYTDGTSADG